MFSGFLSGIGNLVGDSVSSLWSAYLNGVVFLLVLPNMRVGYEPDWHEETKAGFITFLSQRAGRGLFLYRRDEGKPKRGKLSEESRDNVTVSESGVFMSGKNAV